jgi:hypothetical protein
MNIGLFINANGITIPAGTNSVYTEGYSEAGAGAAAYVYSSTPPTVANAVFLDSSGRAFVLDELLITPEMLGARGDGSNNDTVALQNLSSYINWRGGGTVYFQPKATYIVGLQTNQAGSGPYYTPQPNLNFVSCDGLILLGNGARIQNAPGLHYGSFDPSTGQRYDPPAGGFSNSAYSAAMAHIVQFNTCSHVTVQDLCLDGNSDNVVLGGYYGDKGYQIPGDCLRFTASDFIELRDLELINAPHDSLYLNIIGNSNTGTAELTGSFLAENVLCDRAGRQGVSITGGSGFMFRNCRFLRSGQGQIHSPPMAGVDIEPVTRWASDITFEQCQFVANGGTQLIADSGTSIRTTVRRCVFWGGFDGTQGGLTKPCGHALWIDKPSWVLEDCEIHGTFGTIFPGTQFARCQIDVAVHPVYGQSGLNQSYILNSPGGAILHDCVVEVPIGSPSNSLMSSGTLAAGPMYAHDSKFRFGGPNGYTGGCAVLWNHVFENCDFVGLQSTFTSPRPQFGSGGGTPVFRGTCTVSGNARVNNYVDGSLPVTVGDVQRQAIFQPTDLTSALSSFTAEYRTTLPTGGFYQSGSLVMNAGFTAGGIQAWVCTATGALASVAWAAATSYKVGDLRANDGGKSYRCIVSGTSAAAGGPTGTATSIDDGTAVWRFYPAPLWQALGYDVQGITEVASSILSLSISASATNTQRWKDVFTANKTATISSNGAISGRRYRLVRTSSATGAFALNVVFGGTTLKTLNAGEWCEVEYSSASSAFVLVAAGSGI